MFPSSDPKPIIRWQGTNNRFLRTLHAPAWAVFLTLPVVVLVAFVGLGIVREQQEGVEREGQKKEEGTLQQMEDDFRLQELKIKGEGEIQRAKAEYEAIMGHPYPETPEQEKALEEKMAEETLDLALTARKVGSKWWIDDLRRIIEDHPKTRAADKARRILKEITDKEDAAEAEKERNRQAAEEEALRQHQKQLELDRKREADRQRQMKIDEQEKKARKLLRPALQLKVRGGFDKQVREHLQEIIDKYPDTPSAKEAQRQLDKMAK